MEIQNSFLYHPLYVNKNCFSARENVYRKQIATYFSSSLQCHLHGDGSCEETIKTSCQCNY